MGDDARRPLNQEERTRIKAARYYGDACLAYGKPIKVRSWVERRANVGKLLGRG
jgi:hypothetical protein